MRSRLIVLFYLACLLFVPSTSLVAKQTVCLNMIVKNESRVITRCLDSVKPLIDHWVIVDTGSTDGTQEIIREHMKEIPGELFERPWKNFGHNRTEALNLAKDRADYLLIIDADDWLEFAEGYKLPHLTEKTYQLRRGTKDFSHYMVQLVKADLPLKWVGAVHEYLDIGCHCTPVTIHEIDYVSGDDGSSHYDPEKFWRFTKLFEEELKEDPHNTRAAFYLAESYRCVNEYAKSIECYQKRVNMKGWDQEVFWSLLHIAKMQTYLDLDEETIVASFNRAHRYRPHRLEPIYYLAEYYNSHNQYALAYELIKGASFLPQPQTPDILFQENWVENWGLLFQLSLSTYYLGHYEESLETCRLLQKRDDLPDNYREQVAENIKFPLEKLAA